MIHFKTDETNSPEVFSDQSYNFPVCAQKAVFIKEDNQKILKFNLSQILNYSNFYSFFA
jgi:hypothetical protein